jgi:hypothetical protein
MNWQVYINPLHQRLQFKPSNARPACVGRLQNYREGICRRRTPEQGRSREGRCRQGGPQCARGCHRQSAQPSVCVWPAGQPADKVALVHAL